MKWTFYDRTWTAMKLLLIVNRRIIRSSCLIDGFFKFLPVNYALWEWRSRSHVLEVGLWRWIGGGGCWLCCARKTLSTEASAACAAAAAVLPPFHSQQHQLLLLQSPNWNREQLLLIQSSFGLFFNGSQIASCFSHAWRIKGGLDAFANIFWHVDTAVKVVLEYKGLVRIQLFTAVYTKSLWMIKPTKQI